MHQECAGCTRGARGAQGMCAVHRGCVGQDLGEAMPLTGGGQGAATTWASGGLGEMVAKANGAMVAYDLRRHQDTISQRRRSSFARVDLSSFFIVNFSARMCLSGSSLISLSLLSFPGGLFLFLVLLYVDLLISMRMFRLLGRGPQVGPSPLGPFWAL